MIKHATIQGHPVTLDRNVLTVHHPDTEDLRSKTWTLSAKDLNNEGIISLKAAYDITQEIMDEWGTLFTTEYSFGVTEKPRRVRFIKELRELGRVEIPAPFTLTFNTEEDYSFAVQLLVNAGLEGWK